MLVTHIRPDGDTLGSAAALCHILRRMGKTAYVYDNPETTKKYAPWTAPYLAPADFVPACVVGIDLASERLFPKGLPEDTAFDLCIDHHPTNTGYAKELYCLPDKASCGEAILLIAKELGGLDKTVADLLYIAISTDCGCFVYANTTAETHRAAAELMEAGADYRPINISLFRQFSFSRLMLEGLIYSSMKSYADGRVNVATVTLDMMERSGATEDDCDDLASLAGRVDGGYVSVTIRELGPNDCKVSLRSGQNFDVSAICALHGGGGHRMASGCSIAADPETTREIIVREILEAL
ncbi:MAG: bifunctional oligoribonuclease/PAP phosphatase NrnA [Oscillospiraceae bacterium]